MGFRYLTDDVLAGFDKYRVNMQVVVSQKD